jgi:hypothetical protein
MRSMSHFLKIALSYFLGNILLTGCGAIPFLEPESHDPGRSAALLPG